MPSRQYIYAMLTDITVFIGIAYNNYVREGVRRREELWWGGGGDASISMIVDKTTKNVINILHL